MLLVWLAFLYFTFELLDLWPNHKWSRRWKTDVLFRNFCWLIWILPTFVLHDSWLSIHRWSEKWYIWLFSSITSLQFNLYSYCHEQIWIILQNTSFSSCKKHRPADGKNSKSPFMQFSVSSYMCSHIIYFNISFVACHTEHFKGLKACFEWFLKRLWALCKKDLLCYTFKIADRAGWEYRQTVIK